MFLKLFMFVQDNCSKKAKKQKTASDKQALETQLAGIKRPPALLSSDTNIDLENYEVAHLEPLHDLKTMIGKYADGNVN